MKVVAYVLAVVFVVSVIFGFGCLLGTLMSTQEQDVVQEKKKPSTVDEQCFAKAEKFTAQCEVECAHWSKQSISELCVGLCVMAEFDGSLNCKDVLKVVMKPRARSAKAY